MFAGRNHGSREREGFAFYRHECPADRSHPPIKVRRFCMLKVGKESTNPRRKVSFERFTIRAGRGAEVSAGQPRHDLA